jgi:hypothetical protein
MTLCQSCATSRSAAPTPHQGGRTGAGRAGLRLTAGHQFASAMTDLLMFTEFDRNIADYVLGVGLELKVLLSHEVSADNAGACGGHSDIGSNVRDEVLTASSGRPSQVCSSSLSGD